MKLLVHEWDAVQHLPTAQMRNKAGEAVIHNDQQCALQFVKLTCGLFTKFYQ
jgi:hypothetical protein